MRALGAGIVLWIVLAGAPVAPAAAQDREELQIWAALLSTFDLHEDRKVPSLWLDVHARRGGAGTVHILRPGVGWRVADFLSLWVGYGWVPVFTDGAGTVHEHRIWEQVILQHRTPSRIALQSRTRLEQRFSTAGDDLGWRVREFLRFAWQPSPDVPLGGVMWDELFLGLGDTDWGAPGGFDQNRLFLGMFLKAAPWARFEAGYLSVYVRRATGDLLAHVLAVNLFINAGPPAPPPEPPAPIGRPATKPAPR